MKRGCYKAPFNSLSIVDGFADDCDELIQRCLQSDTLNYHVFCNIWKDMNFALVFQERSSGAEVAEVSEELLLIAKKYMVANTSNYEESVAGLFIVYALVHLQPFPGFAPLRLTPNDIDTVHIIKDIARKQKRYDVLYILGSLLIEGPVQFHIAEREYGLEPPIKKNFFMTSTVDRKGTRPKGVFFRQNEELDLLRELSSLGRRYTRAKALVTGTQKLDRTLSYVSETMPGELSDELKRLINGDEDEQVQRPTSHFEKVQSIKHRAMVETVNEMKHLMSVEARNKSADADGPSTSKARKRPRKSDTTKSCRNIIRRTNSTKTRQGAKKSPRKKRPRYESSDSDDDTTFVPSGDSDDDLSSEKDSDLEDTIDDFIKKYEDNSKVEIEIDTSSEVETKETNDAHKKKGNDDTEQGTVEEVVDDAVISVMHEDSHSQANEALIIPDTLDNRGTREQERTSKEKLDNTKITNRHRKDVKRSEKVFVIPEHTEGAGQGATDKVAVKKTKGGVRRKIKGSKTLRRDTQIRLNSLGILPMLKKNNKE